MQAVYSRCCGRSRACKAGARAGRAGGDVPGCGLAPALAGWRFSAAKAEPAPADAWQGLPWLFAVALTCQGRVGVSRGCRAFCLGMATGRGRDLAGPGTPDLRCRSWARMLRAAWWWRCWAADRITAPATGLATVRIQRHKVLGGLIHEYERAA